MKTFHQIALAILIMSGTYEYVHAKSKGPNAYANAIQFSPAPNYNANGNMIGRYDSYYHSVSINEINRHYGAWFTFDKVVELTLSNKKPKPDITNLVLIGSYLDSKSGISTSLYGVETARFPKAQ